MPNIPLNIQRAAMFKHMEDAGINGGVATTGAWTTRKINHEVFNNVTNLTLDTNTYRMTVPKGNYMVYAQAFMQQTDVSRIRLFDVNADTLILGDNAVTKTSGNAMIYALIRGVMQITTQTITELQYYATNTSSNDTDLGEASNITLPELYATIIFLAV